VYEESFGALYSRFTNDTVELIKRQVKAPARIVDFGASTGRLALPLAKLGYSVTAVEPVFEMVEIIESKAIANKVKVDCKTQIMQDFKGNTAFPTWIPSGIF